MASVEHCLYCFEVLVAQLEKREPMTLYQVIQSWEEYPKGLENGDDEDEQEGDSTPSDSEGLSSASSSRPKLTSSSSSSRSSYPRQTSTTTPRTPTTHLSPNATTASSSTSSASSPPQLSFTPIGIGRKTSQRSTQITESPLFVTWNKASSTQPGIYNLRGCIGTFEAQPLSSGLASYSITSALHDSRFSPVTAKELPRLEVAVTLLTDFEPCSNAMDWQLGVHGLRISFYCRNRRMGATYLPDVAVEQGWTKEETIVSLMKKAGWTGKSDRWKEVGDLRVVRYQGKKESVEFDEFRAWRDWVVKGRRPAK